MGAHQRSQGGGPQERGIAREDDDVAIVGVLLGEGGEGHQEGIPGSPLHVLLDEVEVQAGRWLLSDGLGPPRPTVADDHHGPLQVQLGQGEQDMHHHGPAAQPMQGFGALRMHARPLPRGQHHR